MFCGALAYFREIGGDDLNAKTKAIVEKSLLIGSFGINLVVMEWSQPSLINSHARTRVSGHGQLRVRFALVCASGKKCREGKAPL